MIEFKSYNGTLEKYIKERIGHSNKARVSKILDVVAEFKGVPIQEVTRKTRRRDIVYTRQLCHYFCYYYTTETMWGISEQLGKQDHATVHHSVKVVNELSSTYKYIQEEVDQIKLKLKEIGIEKVWEERPHGGDKTLYKQHLR